ncbi:hypothetical protein [Aeromonas caviae]|uniref:hypothetical protein n=1 Tax=Aeromonas caviae TaxID=648 RepID=UPI0025B7079D|nr:hypothetical protein [Aeromonas caviae]
MATRENRYIIRLAGEADGAGLTGLFAQLGYPNPDGAVSARLAQPDPAREVLVALCEGIPVGVLVWHHLQPMHLAPALSRIHISEPTRPD